MKILILTTSFYGFAGDSVNERQLIMALAKRVEKCYVVAFVGFRYILRKQKLEVVRPKNMIIFPVLIPHIHSLVTRFAYIGASYFVGIISLILSISKKIDLVYIRNSFLSIGFLTFQTLAKKTIVKIPAIAEDEILREGLTRSLIGKTAQSLDRLVLSRAKKIAVSSTSFYGELVRKRSVKHNDKPLEMPAGVDLQMIKKVKMRIHEEFPRNTISIGYVGSFSWWQGVGILVNAIALLKEKMPNLRLVLVGDGKLRPLIEEMCKTSKIAYEITGFVSHEEALRRLDMLEVLVLPRRRTTTTEFMIPIKVLEAWALGKPVIVTKHQVFLVNQVRNFEDVIYCEPNPINVANAIFTLLHDDDLRKRLEMNGPRIAMQFDYDRMAENLLKSTRNLEKSQKIS